MPTRHLLADPALALLAQVLDDLERTRIANENRLRIFMRPLHEEDADGEQRGLGLTEADPSVATLIAIVSALRAQEHQAALALSRAMRKHPLGGWVKASIGVGEKQGARLLAAIGDPAWNYLHDRPRLVSELWAYCGYHVVDGKAAARARGAKANWSGEAKMRAFLVAESCIKQRSSPYRAVYEAGREKYDGALHQAECRRCGPAGKPAPPGSVLSAGHQHARALRLVSKAVLRDLWAAARLVHQAGAS